ncbi:MAG: hypothetical protein FVQ81_11010 [Candidatus Glassbacteria bacterium]|nr:hypothetical protein [Candidatus Glassbacteria bacterium]
MKLRKKAANEKTRGRRIRNYLRDLLWHERAQIRETARVFIVFLLSITIMVIFFGAVLYVIEYMQGNDRTLIQCFYFIWITFSTIGYTDDGFITGSPIRLIIILIGAFLITRFIVLSAHVYARVVVEEVYNLKIVRVMEKILEQAQGHFLIFGDDRELINKIIEGLIKRSLVFLISEDREMLQEYKQEYPEINYIMAKPTKAETVEQLRPDEAAGAYLLYREDERNILLAAMLEKRVRIISSFSGAPASAPRFRKLGVEPISPHFSGGLKMVSSMIRPQVTEFLDRFLFPDTAALDFRVVPHEELDSCGAYTPLAAMQDGKMKFGEASVPGGELVVIGFKDHSAATTKLGRLESPELPLKSDKFLVLGGGIIGSTIVAELEATLRQAVIIETSEEKLEKMRNLFGDERIEYIAGDALSSELDVDQFDGVSICTPVDEKNFAIGLDFAGHDLILVVRAVDEDMEFHYRRIGAIPVFVGRVGSGRMLREVTNQFANRVLLDMLMQEYRLDQVYIKDLCTPAELAAGFRITPIALCRDSQCYFAPDGDEPLKRGDTLIFCGKVSSNRKLRIAHLLTGE